MVAEFWYDNFGLKLENRDNANSINCGVGRFITVFPDGSVYPCHLLAFPEFCVGNVRENSLYSILHHSHVLNKFRGLDFCSMANQDEYFQKHIQCSNTCIGRFAQENETREKLMQILNNNVTSNV